MHDSEREIAELAGGCVLAVEQATGMTLDFTQDTLPILDHYVEEASGAERDVRELVATMSGAYFGEVVRRHLGPARWHAPSARPDAFLLEFEEVFLAFNPVGVALEAIARAPQEGVGAHLAIRPSDRARVKAALDLFGDAREEDYFRLSVRFEAIEQAVHTLSTLEARSDPPRRYGPDAYAHLRADAERRPS